MPSQRFLSSIALLGCIGSLLCMIFTSLLERPALLFYVALFWGLLAKTCFNRRLLLPSSGIFRIAYALLMLVLGLGFFHYGGSRLEAQALELEARQTLDQLVAERVHFTDNTALLDEVIVWFQQASERHPQNADVWLGLSAGYNQLYFNDPSGYREFGMLAVGAAEKALAISDTYWRSWAQLGISHALSGEAELAEAALSRALELAPNASNAQYFWASFLSSQVDRLDEARSAVERAIEINSENSAAIRLRQKLLIQ